MTLALRVVRRWLAMDDVHKRLATSTRTRYYGPPLEGHPAVGPGRTHPVHFVDAPDGVPVSDGSPVWSWWTDDSTPLTVQDITCKIPSDEGASHELLVAPSLRWSSVEVVSSDQTIALTLDHRFILARIVTEGGAAPFSGLGQECVLDECIAVLFAAALSPGERGPTLSPLGDNHDGAWIALTWWFRSGRAARHIDPLHALLAVPLETTVSAFGSSALDGLSATLHLSRPEQTKMIGCEADVEGRYRARAGGGCLVLPPDSNALPALLVKQSIPWVLAPPLRPYSSGAPAIPQLPIGHHDALHWLAPREASTPRATVADGLVMLDSAIESRTACADGTVTLSSGAAFFGMDVDRTGESFATLTRMSRGAPGEEVVGGLFGSVMQARPQR
ncbi:MAG: hypothetical protein U0325_30225 [Polyangiales bacterium]